MGASWGPRGPGERYPVGSAVGRKSETQSERTETTMRKFLAATMSVVTVFSLSATVGMAQTTSCPEVASAKAMLTQTAKSQDVQAPRSLAGARSQDVQAPRSQDVQAPRSLAGARPHDVQAPRRPDIHAPRGQDVQAPRGHDIQAPRGRNI